jgi:hypothetical protein
MLTQERLKQILDYNPDTGIWIWIGKTHPRTNDSLIGTVAGTNIHGYREIIVAGYHYYAHRLAWFYMTGMWPKQIDHINGIKDDNRWSNLREATRSQNSFNRPKQRNNSSGYKGVTKIISGTRNPKVKWAARIMHNQKGIHIGLFDSKEDAAQAYNQTAMKLHGEYYRADISCS